MTEKKFLTDLAQLMDEAGKCHLSISDAMLAEAFEAWPRLARACQERLDALRREEKGRR